MNVSLELISRYVDGEVTPEEARLVEEALATEPEVAHGVDDLSALAELFGHVEPEEVSLELKERLYALRPVQPLASFEPVAAAPRVRRSWLNWSVAAAAVALLAFGIQTLAHRPEVTLHEYLRQTLGPDGSVVATERFAQKKARAGDLLRAAEDERVSYHAADGSLVVLMPGGELALGDPESRELFELSRGTVLCTVKHRGGEARTARAAGYVIHADDADFGVRIAGAPVKAAGPVPGRRAEVAVAVRSGMVEIGENGDRAVVRADEAIVLRPGAPARRAHAWEDPLYRALMRRIGREIIPGYFDAESSVATIRYGAWYPLSGGGLGLVLTDTEAAAVAHYLVLYARVEKPTELRLTRVRPYADRPGLAETVTVAATTDERGVVAIPLDAFDGDGVERAQRKIPAGRSRLVRLELRTQENEPLSLRASLWAARPPAGPSEVVR